MADSNNWVVVDATSLGYPGEKRWYNKTTGEYRLSREGYFDPAGGTGSPSDMRAIGNVFNGLWQGVSDHFDPTSAKYQKPVSNYDIHQGADLNPAVYLDGTGGNLDRNVTQVTPAPRARDAAYIEMAQQHDPDYWSREENAAINAATLANADRTDGTLRVTSDMEGYEDRADIQAWLAANPGMKENFLANRARKAEAGLLKPNPNFTPAEVSAEDIDAHIADYGGGRSEEAARDYLSGKGTEWNTDMGVGEEQSPIPNQSEEVSRALAQQQEWEKQQLGHGPDVYAATEGPVTLESFQPYASEKPMGDAQSMFYQYQDLYGDQGMTEADAFAIATGQRPELSAGQFKEFNAVKNKLLEDAARLRGRQ